MSKLNFRTLFSACAILTSSLACMTPSQAQSVELPKVWLGIQTATTFGAPAPLHPKHSEHVGANDTAKGWGSFVDEKFKLEIKRQVGRHLDLTLSNSKHSLTAVGTLSADGKQMLIKTRFFTIPFAINGNSISGCGGSNGNDGTIEHWLNNYAALCFEATAAK